MSVMATSDEHVDGADEPSLARDMIDVHGPKSALAGQRPQAKFWIRVLGAHSAAWHR
jgi:hypothetical protein